jgi:hypothetical protein
MKKYETPVIEIVLFENQDVITSSQGGGVELPWLPV